MTTLVPLDEGRQPHSVPAFVSHSAQPATDLERVVKTILKARRIAVVCGAGISVQAGIPDFRSAHGLFQSLKKENPKENITSGKDLFDASVFNNESSTALFCHMMARLSRLSEGASPSPFHKLLSELDRRGKLQRVYTQNIDALEQKAGMTFGVPERSKQNRAKGATKLAKGFAEDSAGDEVNTSTTGETPRCVPLHGTLQMMHCVSCAHQVSLNDYRATLLKGVLPECPECALMQETRSANGMRLRTVGKLRPSVVLYNEEHRDGEDVGSVVERDLPGRRSAGPDLLLVVGTSLRVPGTKRIVREFSKAVKTREEARMERVRNAAQKKADTATSVMVADEGRQAPIPSPTPSPRRSPAPGETEDSSVTSIYLNLDFPVPSREWDGVFDAWVQGDAQAFAYLLQQEMRRMDREREEKADREQRAREERLERKKQKQLDRELKETRRKMKAMMTERKPELKKVLETPVKKRATQKSTPSSSNPAKRRKVTLHVKSPSSSAGPRSSQPQSSPFPSESNTKLQLQPGAHKIHSAGTSRLNDQHIGSQDTLQLRTPHRDYWSTILAKDEPATKHPCPQPYATSSSSSSSTSSFSSSLHVLRDSRRMERDYSSSEESVQNARSHSHELICESDQSMMCSKMSSSALSPLTPLPSPSSASFHAPFPLSGDSTLESGTRPVTFEQWEPPTPPSAPKRKRVAQRDTADSRTLRPQFIRLP